MKDKIIEAIHQMADESGWQIVSEFNDDTVLLESGLDSLGFAILVAKLEEELQCDPFALMDEPVYPRTLGEFVAMYERFAS